VPAARFATTTETGLTVAAVMDTNHYLTGVRISDAQINAFPVRRYAFHGEPEVGGLTLRRPPA
jgi:hypothetical protein